jgi:acyl-CoA thioester hydrolase
MSARWSEYRYRRRVHFYEPDPAGIVHFSTYFRYMEEAEHALWRAAGLSIAPRGAEVGFPRVSASCEYRAPLRFEDEFEVHLRVAAMGTTSMRYACTIRSGDGTLVATGTLAIVSVSVRSDAPMRPVPLPDYVRDRFEVATVPADAADAGETVTR